MPWKFNTHFRFADIKAELGIQSFLTMAVLFSIVAGVFMFYAAPMITVAVTGALKDEVKDSLKNAAVATLPPADPTLQVIAGMKELFSKPDAVIVQSNKDLFVLALVVSLLLLAFTGILLYNNRTSVPVAPVLLENLGIFFFVCAVEFCFFFFIASKFHPTEPSFMAEATLTGLKTYL